MSTKEKKWAAEAADYINPYSQPEPSEETGPGSHFRPVNASDTVTTKSPYVTLQEQATGGSNSPDANPYRRASLQSKNMASVHTRNVSSGSNNGSPGFNINTNTRNVSGGSTSGPSGININTNTRNVSSGSNSGNPKSNMTPHNRNVSSGSNGARASPAHGQFPSPPLEAFPGEPLPRRSQDVGRPEPANIKTRPRRVSSLNERFPGDQSVRPLDMLKHDAKAADRAPHLRKKHIPGADMVDRLDDVLGSYHHEGPYDAALLARNTSFETSPVAALERSNQEALKATPKEKIRDSIVGHRPLDGVATNPPGTRDQYGRGYNYQEGTNMMIDDAEGGEYKRWPGVEYDPDDIEGKGEPAYSVEQAVKNHQLSEEEALNANYIELVERPRKSSNSVSKSPFAQVSATEVSAGEGSSSVAPQKYVDWEQEHVKKPEGHRFSGELKRRIGSLRKKDK